MEMLQHFNRLFRFDDWANRETLASLKALEAPPERSVKLLAHIIAAEWVWLNRIKDEPQIMAVWPDLTLAQIETELAELQKHWSSLLNSLTASSLEETITYKNSKGEAWSSPILDILNHLSMHSTYHRGQIAADLRANGFNPPYTDFIHAARQGFI